MSIHVLREAPGRFTWLDVSEPTRGELESLSVRYGLNPYTLADSLEPDHLPKHELLGEIHFIIVRTVIGETPPQADSVQEMTDKLAIFYAGDFLITIHRSAQPYFAALAASGNVTAAGDMVTRILGKVLDTYDQPAVSLTRQVDELERRIFLRGYGANMHEALYYIRRKASVCHKLLLLSEAAINAVKFQRSRRAAGREGPACKAHSYIWTGKRRPDQPP